MPNRKLDQEIRKQNRKRGRKAEKAEPPSQTRPARPAEDEAEEQLPELSERGGVEPSERSPSEYHDRSRDRTLDEG
jgi:hypothetical protein